MWIMSETHSALRYLWKSTVHHSVFVRRLSICIPAALIGPHLYLESMRRGIVAQIDVSSTQNAPVGVVL